MDGRDVKKEESQLNSLWQNKREKKSKQKHDRLLMIDADYFLTLKQ